MTTKLAKTIETISRHLVCGLAALVAGGIALGVAAGPVEAKGTVPVKVPAPAAKIIIIL